MSFYVFLDSSWASGLGPTFFKKSDLEPLATHRDAMPCYVGVGGREANPGDLVPVPASVDRVQRHWGCALHFHGAVESTMYKILGWLLITIWLVEVQV